MLSLAWFTSQEYFSSSIFGNERKNILCTFQQEAFCAASATRYSHRRDKAVLSILWAPGQTSELGLLRRRCRGIKSSNKT